MTRTDARAIRGIHDTLITERQLADRWATTPRTLQRKRADGSGPVYIRIGASIRYRMSDVLTFEDANREGIER